MHNSLFNVCFQLDIRAIAIITLLLGYITNVFIDPGGPLLALFLIIGPLIVKIFYITLFF